MGFGRQPGKLVLRCWAVNGSLAVVGVSSKVVSGWYDVVREALIWNLITQLEGRNLLFGSSYVLWILGLCRLRASMVWLPPLVTSIVASPQGGQGSPPGS